MTGRKSARDDMHDILCEMSDILCGTERRGSDEDAGMSRLMRVTAELIRARRKLDDAGALGGIVRNDEGAGSDAEIDRLSRECDEWEVLYQDEARARQEMTRRAAKLERTCERLAKMRNENHRKAEEMRGEIDRLSRMDETRRDVFRMLGIPEMIINMKEGDYRDEILRWAERVISEHGADCGKTDGGDDAKAAALELIHRYGGIDGGHHKQWVLDQVVRLLTGDGYDEWVRETCDGKDGPHTYEWDTGIPP